MSKDKVTVLAICNEPHLFEPGVCIACERDSLKAQLEAVRNELKKARIDALPCDAWDSRCMQYSAQLSALRESAKLAEAVCEAELRFIETSLQGDPKLAQQVGTALRAWRSHRAKSLEGGEGK